MKYAAVALAVALSTAVVLMWDGSNMPTGDGPNLPETQPAERSSQPYSPSFSPHPAADGSRSSEQPSISFLNSRTITITLRKQQEDSHPRPLEMLLNYGYFKSLAERGDAELQYKLFSAVENCERIFPSSEENLEAAISKMYQTRNLPLGPDGRILEAVRDVQNMDKMARDIRRISESCWSIPEQDREAGFFWLENAAAKNYVPALMTLGNRFQGGTPDALESFERAWKLGNINALHQIALIFRSGRGLDEPDPIQSFAYNYLHSHISIIDHQTNGSDDADGKIRGRQSYLKSLTDRLYAYEVEDGINLAEQLLADNPNCCVSRYR